MNNKKVIKKLKEVIDILKKEGDTGKKHCRCYRCEINGKEPCYCGSSTKGIFNLIVDIGPPYPLTKKEWCSTCNKQSCKSVVIRR